MKLKVIALVAVLGLFGCKGEKGDKGDTGLPGGPSGQQPLTSLTGSVPNDNFLVTDLRIADAEGILVYGVSSAGILQLPIFNPTGGYNVLWVYLGASSIQILNAKTGGFTGYIIVLVN